MFSSVFKDLRYFLMFFSMFIVTFALFLSVAIDDTHSIYSDTGPFTFFLMAFRSSIGDNDMESFLTNKES